MIYMECQSYRAAAVERGRCYACVNDFPSEWCTGKIDCFTMIAVT
jgi:hypothetical protein